MATHTDIADDNRRQHPRYTSDIDVDIATADSEALCPGVIRNISAGGFFVAIDPSGLADLSQAVVQHFRHGTRLGFVLNMTMEPSRLDLSGTVRWYTETFEAGQAGAEGCGVQLYQLNTEQRRVWHYLVKTFRMRHPSAPAFSPKQKQS